MLALESQFAVLDQLAFLDEYYDNSDDAMTKDTPRVSRQSPTSSKKRKRSYGEVTLPENPAQYYIGKLVTAMNDYDSSALYRFIESISVPNLQIVKRIYSLSLPPSVFKQEYKPLVDTEFCSIQAFCQYLSTWHTFVPNGIFKAANTRTVVHTQSTFLFMSTLRFSGVNIAPAVDLLNSSLENHHWQHHEQIVMKSIMGNYHSSSGKPCTERDVCNLQGSLALFVNAQGELEKLEIYISRD